MRQRMLMFFKPNPIAHVDIAVTERATFEMFGLAQWRPADLLPMIVPRGRGSSIGMIAVICASQTTPPRRR
jgi:hypothetical protein